ncbi:hypothetical protein ES703_119602 [subsurface metagenome]
MVNKKPVRGTKMGYAIKITNPIPTFHRLWVGSSPTGASLDFDIAWPIGLIVSTILNKIIIDAMIRGKNAPAWARLSLPFSFRAS